MSVSSEAAASRGPADRLRTRWADGLLTTGLVAAALGACCSIPLMYGAYAVSAAGALLLPRPFAAFLIAWPWAAALSAWMCLTTLLSPYAVGFSAPGFVYTWPAVAVWGLAVSRLRRLEVLPALLALGGALALALGILQYVIGFDGMARPLRLSSGGERWVHATGFYSHWIRYGDGMAIWGAWLAALLLSWPGGRRLRWLAVGGSLVAAGMGVAVSSARGAVLAFAAGVWGAFAGGGVRRAVVGTGVIIVLVAALLGCLWLQQPERVQNAVQGQDGRNFIWRAAWQAFIQHPLTGVGHGAYNAAATAVVDAGLAPRGVESPAMGNAHSSYLSLLVLHGIPGLGLWLGWLTVLVVAIWRRRAGHPAAWPVALATVLVLLVGGLTEDLAAYASSRFQLFLGLGIALGLAGRNRGETAFLHPCESSRS